MRHATRFVRYVRRLLITPVLKSSKRSFFDHRSRRRRTVWTSFGTTAPAEILETRIPLSGSPLAVPTQPSIVTVSGRQVLVQDRLPDGSLADPIALVAHGVNWPPHSIGGSTANQIQEFFNWDQTDIPLMQQMGVNVVRTYHDFGTGSQASQILDAFYQAGIKVIVTVDSPQFGVVGDLSNISNVVTEYKNHPAILMWNVGIEWDLNRYQNQFSTLTEAAQHTEQAATLIKSLDSNHPVTTAIADPHISNVHPLSQQAFPFLAGPYTSEIVNNLVPSVDVWSTQVYRNDSFQDLFQQWKSISTEPMFVTEFGVDAYDHRVNGENQAMQSQINASLWDELQFNLSANSASGVAVGGLVFSWNDEWWKNLDPSIHNVTNEANAGQPDGFNDEEWFGIVDINRQMRQAGFALKDRFINGQFASSLNATPTIEATSQMNGSTARFKIDRKTVFQRAGGQFGARGINVALLDSNTGIQMTEVRSFDTWYSPSGFGGTHVNFTPLINYLNSLPNGAIISLSIADEGGFINPNTGNPWLEAVIEQTYQTLEALGSTQIRNVGYTGGWAMIAIKGQGVLAENFSGAGLPVTVSAQVVSLRGQWASPAGALTSISQNGVELTFVNGLGNSTTGAFISATQVLSQASPGWGSSMTGTFTRDGTLVWANGAVWNKLDLARNYAAVGSFGSAPVYVIENGTTTLTFVNRLGQTSPGNWISPTQVVATGFGITGTVNNGTIQWSNGALWNKNLTVQGSPAGNPDTVSIVATNTGLTLTNRLGQVSAGRIIGPNRIEALGFGITGTRQNGRILWSNGGIWENFGLNDLNAVFSDIRNFPFG